MLVINESSSPCNREGNVLVSVGDRKKENLHGDRSVYEDSQTNPTPECDSRV